jgi:hypothetical protein
MDFSYGEQPPIPTSKSSSASNPRHCDPCWTPNEGISWNLSGEDVENRQNLSQSSCFSSQNLNTWPLE